MTMGEGIRPRLSVRGLLRSGQGRGAPRVSVGVEDEPGVVQERRRRRARPSGPSGRAGSSRVALSRRVENHTRSPDAVMMTGSCSTWSSSGRGWNRVGLTTVGIVTGEYQAEIVRISPIAKRLTSSRRVGVVTPGVEARVYSQAQHHIQEIPMRRIGVSVTESIRSPTSKTSWSGCPPIPPIGLANSCPTPGSPRILTRVAGWLRNGSQSHSDTFIAWPISNGHRITPDPQSPGPIFYPCRRVAGRLFWSR